MLNPNYGFLDRSTIRFDCRECVGFRENKNLCYGCVNQSNFKNKAIRFSLSNDELDIYKRMINHTYGWETQDEDTESLYPKYGLGMWPKDNPHIDVIKYCQKDIETTMELHKTLKEREENDMAQKAAFFNTKTRRWETIGIEKVIYNGPATIVMWTDNTKTVVKCQDGDRFDTEKGLAMAITKKFLGNKSNCWNEFNKHQPGNITKKCKGCAHLDKKDFKCMTCMYRNNYEVKKRKERNNHYGYRSYSPWRSC